MPRRDRKFETVTFSWMLPPAERQQVETLLASLGFEVDGGGTNLDAGTAEIYIRPKRRVRRSRSKAEVAS